MDEMVLMFFFLIRVTKNDKVRVKRKGKVIVVPGVK